MAAGGLGLLRLRLRLRLLELRSDVRTTGHADDPCAADLSTPKKEKKDGSTLSPNRARLEVQVPADAKLFIDDQAIPLASTSKTFNTPALERGQAYYYILAWRWRTTVSPTRRRGAW